jgi:hypothetical protein
VCALCYVWAGQTSPRPGHGLGCSLFRSRAAATACYPRVRVLDRRGAAGPSDVVRRRRHAILGAATAQVVPGRDARPHSPPDCTDLLRARLPGHPIALPRHVKTGQAESDLPCFFSAPWPTGRSVDYGKEATSSQFLASRSSPLDALVDRPYSALCRARASRNFGAFHPAMPIKPSPAIT